ncbi:MAG TPA: RNA polymerase sigma factor SigE [Nocardioides sp.]|nr:RNA polymerase sigma factor SigE [Nocardioides sp.]
MAGLLVRTPSRTGPDRCGRASRPYRDAPVRRGWEHRWHPGRCAVQAGRFTGFSQSASIRWEDRTLFRSQAPTHTLTGHQEAPLETTDGVPTWDEVVERHSDRVYRLAYRLTGDRHDAEDLTQEVFVRVFRSLSTYTPGTFEGWLHRITTNLFLDQARRKQRIRFDALSDEAASRLPSALPTPDVAQLDRTFDADVEAALASLAPDFRAAVVLCDVEGLSYEEIADVLGLKLGTVRSRIHRGRAMLRRALAHRAPVDGRERYAGPDRPPTPRRMGS